MCGTAAVALNSRNGNLVMNDFAIDKIDKITFVITVNFKVSGGFTDRTCFKFRPEKRHEMLKKRF